MGSPEQPVWDRKWGQTLARPWRKWRILSLNPQTDLLGWPESFSFFKDMYEHQKALDFRMIAYPLLATAL